MESNTRTKKVDSLAGINRQRVILVTYLIAAIDITCLFVQFSITPVSTLLHIMLRSFITFHCCNMVICTDACVAFCEIVK